MVFICRKISMPPEPRNAMSSFSAAAPWQRRDIAGTNLRTGAIKRHARDWRKTRIKRRATLFSHTTSCESWTKWIGPKAGSGWVWKQLSARPDKLRCENQSMKTLRLAAPGPTRMTHLIRRILLCLLLVAATAAYGGVPAMNVIVSDASGKVAFKGTTKASATFATEKLAPGNYVVQFQSKNGALKGNQYLLVVSAGKKKVIAEAVPGEKINGAGVAMRITVDPGLKITGQVATDQGLAAAVSGKIKVINGKRFVWVKAGTGSNLGDHWEDVSVAPLRNVVRMSTDKLRQIQDRSFEGSMLDKNGGLRAYDLTTYEGGY